MSPAHIAPPRPRLLPALLLPGLLLLGVASAGLAGRAEAGAASRPQQTGPGGWTTLPMPGLASPSAGAVASEQLGPLTDGRFLRDPEASIRPARSPGDGRGPGAAGAVLGLLQNHAAARGLGLELPGLTEPLLARGSDEALAEARGVLRGLDAFSSALDVRLEVWLVPGATGGSDALPTASADYEATVRSGQRVSLGARASTAFLTGYDVEVATDSGVADPVTSHAITGSVVHLEVARVRAGAAVHLSGMLELSRLVGDPTPFDPDTPDLGRFEQPEVRVAQLTFSDVVPSGGHTWVNVTGSVDGWADTGLWVRATTAADPLSAGDPTLWEGFDLALLERRSETLPLVAPGYGMPHVRGVEEQRTVLAEAFGAAQIASAAAAGGRGRPSPAWAHGLLFVPGGGPEATAARALIDAVELDRLGTVRLRVAQGTLRLSLPVAAAQPLRLLYGIEREQVVDYGAHIASESWMPVPEVRRVFDGVCVQGYLELGARELRGYAWVAETLGTRTLERTEVGLGRLQLPARSFEQGDFRLAANETGGPRAWTLRANAPGLTVELD